MKTAILAVLILVMLSCGKVNSSDDGATLIPSPISGYKCFLIKSDGKAVGGNCVREN